MFWPMYFKLRSCSNECFFLALAQSCFFFLPSNPLHCSGLISCRSSCFQLQPSDGSKTPWYPEFTVSDHSNGQFCQLKTGSCGEVQNGSRSGTGWRTSTSTLSVEKGLKAVSSLTFILNTHRLKLLLGGLGQFRQVQATQRHRHRQRSKRTPETYRQRKMRRERGREKRWGWMDGAWHWGRRGVRFRKKKQAEQELRFEEVFWNIALHVYHVNFLLKYQQIQVKEKQKNGLNWFEMLQMFKFKFPTEDSSISLLHLSGHWHPNKRHMKRKWKKSEVMERGIRRRWDTSVLGT